MLCLCTSGVATTSTLPGFVVSGRVNGWSIVDSLRDGLGNFFQDTVPKRSEIVFPRGMHCDAAAAPVSVSIAVGIIAAVF